MTIQEAKQKLIRWAEAQIGTREGVNNWNRYAAGMEKLYGWDVQNQPWCDVFVDAGFVECFGLDLACRMTYQFPGCAGAACRYSAQYYKNAGRWFSVPQSGDQIFLYVDGGINHTGIVTAVEDGRVYTVEGNSSDMVARRSYALTDGRIAGYGRPNWSVIEGAADPPADSPDTAPAEPEAPAFSYHPYTYAVRVNLLKKGSYGPQVANMQHLLKDHGFDPGKVDGKFGGKTFDALTAFQTEAGIGVDGEWGGESFNAMWNYTNIKEETV